MARKKYLGVDAGRSNGVARLGVDIPAGLKLEFDIETRKAGTDMTTVTTFLIREWLDGKVHIPFIENPKK